MREAKAGDWWKALYAGTSNTAVTEIAFENLPGVGAGRLNLTGPLTAICGANGSGKTRLVRAIACLLSSSPLLRSEANLRRLAEAHLRLTVRQDGLDHKVAGRPCDGAASLPAGMAAPEIVWVDPLVHALKLTEILGELHFRDEILEQIGPTDLGEADLNMVSYVVVETMKWFGSGKWRIIQRSTHFHSSGFAGMEASMVLRTWGLVNCAPSTYCGQLGERRRAASSCSKSPSRSLFRHRRSD